MPNWQHSITISVIPNPCFQRMTDWSKCLNMLLNHNFQPKEKDRVRQSKNFKRFLRLDIDRILNLNWRFEEEIPLWTSHSCYLHNGILRGKGSTTLHMTGHYFQVCSEALKKRKHDAPKYSQLRKRRMSTSRQILCSHILHSHHTWSTAFKRAVFKLNTPGIIRWNLSKRLERMDF